MRYATIMFLVLAVLLGSCVSQEEASKSDVSSNNSGLPDKFVGSWILVSFKDANEEGETIYPYGQNAFGRIAYQPNGRMTVVLMQPGREAGEVVDSFEGLSPEEMRSVLNGFFAYTGGYTVDETNQTVTHHIEACLASTWVGRGPTEYANSGSLVKIKYHFDR